MIKKLMIGSTFVLGMLIVAQFASAQTKLERPAKVGIQAIDDFATKSFDSYDESGKITEALNEVNIKNNDQGKAESVTNEKSEPMTKQNALAKLTTLAERLKKQEANVSKVKEYQQPATDALKSCSMLQKPKATKAISKSGEALTKVTDETKKQLEMVNKKLEFVKTLKK
ncbi:hypothetical protein [Williamwhitmania taraxaci]|uniref:Uncharacterized protein n=1 Tax=Williamwhitmania taraxaci TaxID=1640674 RepID=A0A1G6P9W9_9BACT|nr:hypothetical protein [Williamwhitmania taraxaci]SDC76404.1 hypothetical protein SAMN05216323_104922 [Williamwhitmania taraxaci]